MKKAQILSKTCHHYVRVEIGNLKFVFLYINKSFTFRLEKYLAKWMNPALSKQIKKMQNLNGKEIICLLTLSAKRSFVS